jgi:OOP family OmpA-OmpF porin
VREFVRDSFSPSHAGALETVRMGDVNLLVEDGPHAILAGVVRGNPPEDIRSAFSAAQEALHEQFAAELGAFDGDTGPFERTRTLLESCLLHQEQALRRRTSPLIYAVPAILLTVSALFVGREISRETEWSNLVDHVASTDGVLLTSHERHGRGGVLKGAKDRQVSGLDALIAAQGFSKGSVRQEWLPIEVAQPRFELPRIKTALAPPAGVTVAFSPDGRLMVSGEAPHAWVERARHLSGALPGNPVVDMTGIVDVDTRDAVRLSKAVGSVIHYFDVGSGEPSPALESAIRRTAQEILRLSNLAGRSDMGLWIDVVGRADPSGRDAKNRVLSLDRAMAVAAIIEDAGVPRRILTVRGLGTETLGPVSGRGSVRPPHNRCVTYRIHLEPICHD